MNPICRFPLLLAAGVVAASLAGCSRSSGPSIEGQVTIDGIPLPGAQLTFEPLDQSGKLGGAIAVTDATGAFELEPHPATGETLSAGTYAVSVSRKVDPQGNVPAGNDFGQMQAAGMLRETIPVKYMFQQGAPPILSANIVEGDNELKLELQSR
jgi:hypothetical protein